MQAQSYDWSFRVGGISSDLFASIARDAQGNIVSAGSFAYTIDADPGAGVTTLTGIGSGQSALLAKYDSLGNYLWAFRLGGIGTNAALGVATDDSSNVYATGYFSGTADFDPGPGTANLTAPGSAWSIFIAKYDQNGNYRWAYQIGSANGDCDGRSVKVDRHGNLFVTGSFTETVDFDPGAGVTNLTAASPTYFSDAFVASFDTQGQFRWALRAGGSYNDWAYSIAVDSSSNIYITGKFRYTVDFDPGPGTATRTAGGVADIFVASYDSSGVYRWAISMGGNGGDEGLYVSIFNDEYVYVTGLFRDSADFDPGSGVVRFYAAGGVNDADIFVGKYRASNGNYIHAFQLGSVNSEWAWCVEPDALGNIYVTGYFSGMGDFDPGPGVFNLNLSSNQDIFLSIYDSTGYFKNAFGISSNSSDVAYDVLPAVHNCFYLAGGFSGSADFDPGPGSVAMSSAGNNDMFLARYSNCVSADTPLLNSSADTICFNSSAVLSVVSGNINDSYEWYWYAGNCGGTPVDSGASVTVSPPVTTTYYCRGEKKCGGNGYCASITVYVDACTTGIEANQDNIVTVYPNPADGLINLETGFTFTSSTTLMIVDMFGRTVYNCGIQCVEDGKHAAQLNVSDLVNGNYACIIRSGSNSWIGRIVIIH